MSDLINTFLNNIGEQNMINLPDIMSKGYARYIDWPLTSPFAIYTYRSHIQDCKNISCFTLRQEPVTYFLVRHIYDIFQITLSNIINVQLSLYVLLTTTNVGRFDDIAITGSLSI